NAPPNLFESDTLISGGVIRGTLATMLKEAIGLPRDAVIDAQLPAPWQALGEYFNCIRFTHAFCALQSSAARPVTAPLTLVKDAEGQLLKDSQGHVCDVSLCEAPGLLGPSRQAPSFAVDWKNRDDVDALFGWPLSHQIKRELRVRTAMDRDYRRAKDNQLFAYDMVVPEGLIWYGAVDLSDVPAGPDRNAVSVQLHALLQRGLHGIGKTKARAAVDTDVAISPWQPSSCQPIHADTWVITLQTPALLCDPKALDETSGHEVLFNAYHHAWAELSGHHLKLIRFFASQSLAGGYQVYRFQPSKPYNPFLLTDAGSVFVLQAVSDVTAAQAELQKWLAHGLDLPPWAITRYGEDWQTCPFLRHDGFGEIAVNLPCNRQPDAEVFHGIKKSLAH
ncbi:MAG: hypothetical protein ETSY2_33655, partial [Candidatus Entotheonella gemina]